MIAEIASGHLDAADILLLIAAVVFALATLLPLRVRPVVVDSLLIPAGLCLVAVALLVL